MQYPVSPKPLSAWTASVRRTAEWSNGLEGPSARARSFGPAAASDNSAGRVPVELLAGQVVDRNCESGVQADTFAELAEVENRSPAYRCPVVVSFSGFQLEICLEQGLRQSPGRWSRFGVSPGRPRWGHVESRDAAHPLFER